MDSTGKEIRLLALQQLLIKKSIITETEMTEQSGLVIAEMQKEAEEQAKKTAAPAIIPATPEEVSKVTNTPASEVVPPQA